MSRSMKTLGLLIQRNIKLYFKDRITFFMSLISPLILLLLFVTFLQNVYENSLTAFLPKDLILPDSVVNAFTGGWLMSAILGVSCVTIAFCSNIVMVTDKVSGHVTDLLVSPVRRDILALSYYIANVLTTLIVCSIALGVGLLYLSAVGWYLSMMDVLLILADMALCILFGTSLAAVVEYFISSQGGISAVATLVSSMYGFLCGAYMPLSQFSEPIRNVAALIPGTYGAVLLKNHFMRGALAELGGVLPEEGIEGIRKSFDHYLYFFGHKVEEWQMYAVLIVSVVVLLGVYVLINVLKNRRKKGAAIGRVAPAAGE